MTRLSTFLLLTLLLAPAGALAQTAPAAITPGTSQRLFSDVGRGFSAIRRGAAGQYYVLVAPSPAVMVFDSSEKQLRQIPPQANGAAAIAFGTSLDVDAAGRIYVADRGGNAVIVYNADGTLLARVRVNAPTGVAALPDGEFAVSSLNSRQLISVYDFQGELLREFGDLEALASDSALNRRLNLGYLTSDSAGNLYFAFAYLPEPTVHKYDRFGYLAAAISLATPDAAASAHAAQSEIDRAASGALISPREIISAFAVDPSTQELWVATGDLLLHFDADGRILGSDVARTDTGARLDPTVILVEPNRLLLGSDSLGIYEMARPERAKP